MDVEAYVYAEVGDEAEDVPLASVAVEAKVEPRRLRLLPMLRLGLGLEHEMASLLAPPSVSYTQLCPDGSSTPREQRKKDSGHTSLFLHAALSSKGREHRERENE